MRGTPLASLSHVEECNQSEMGFGKEAPIFAILAAEPGRQSLRRNFAQNEPQDLPKWRQLAVIGAAGGAKPS